MSKSKTYKVDEAMQAVGDAVGKITGVQIDAKKVWEEVKENHRKLDTCKRHVFVAIPDSTTPIPRKYKCTACGGTADSINVHWYNLGVQHGGTKA
jgi:hypothetical protein